MGPLATILNRQRSGCQAVIDAWTGHTRPADRPAPRAPRSVATFQPKPQPPIRTVEEQLAILNSGKSS